MVLCLQYTGLEDTWIWEPRGESKNGLIIVTPNDPLGNFAFHLLEPSAEQIEILVFEGFLFLPEVTAVLH